MTYTTNEFLDGRVILFGGDNRTILASAPDDSVDAILTDGPYALVSIVKRFGGANAAPAKGNEAFARASKGFMGKTWDTGEVVNDPGFWAECLRVLKPGGHLLSFGGTRTYHRMACAVEDAGFEIRDMIQWLYGSGFPKSHSVSKALLNDLERQLKEQGFEAEVVWI
jgi:site-specific DNA-methyltransferase (adenine-specific)